MVHRIERYAVNALPPGAGDCPAIIESRGAFIYLPASRVRAEFRAKNS